MIDFTTLYHRAINYQNLSPTERALLKAGQSLLIGAGATAVMAGLEYIQSHGTGLNYQQLAAVLLTTFVFTLAHGLLKFLSASKDPQLSADAAALDATVSQVENDLSRGEPELASDLERVGLSAIPVFEDVAGSNMTAKLPVISPAPGNTDAPTGH